MSKDMKKVKIIYFITKSVWGGAQKYVYDFAVSLPKNIYELLVVAGSEGGVLLTKLQDANIKTIHLENFGRNIKIVNDFKIFRKIIKIIKTEHPDIIHLNSSKMGALGALAGKLYNIPTIFTAHGWAFNEERPALQKLLIKIAVWLTIFISTKTIAVSDKVKKDVLLFPFISKKVSVINNGIIVPNLLSKTKAREKLLPSKLHINTLVLGTISELHTNKGLIYTLGALNTLSKKFLEIPIFYVVIGEGEERKALEDYVKKHNLSSVVFFAGAIDNASQFLNAFDVFILSSITEAFPYTLLEAGHVGLPVIATDVGGVSEIIENNKTGLLIKSKSDEEIINAILFYLKSDTLRKKYGSALKEKVSNSFSKDKMLKKTVDIYKYIVKTS